MQTNVTITFNNLTPEMAEAIIQASLGQGNAPEKVVESEASQNMSFCNTKSITQDEFEIQDTNAQDVQDLQDVQNEKTMEDAIVELGLRLSDQPGTNRLACITTLEKWFSILGYEKFKEAIEVIHKAWPKYYDGVQWHRLIIKDVCLFMMYCILHNFSVDSDLLAHSLSHAVRGEKTITPNEMLSHINQYNGGSTTLERYNAELGNLRMAKLPPISQKERRNIQDGKYRN